LLTGVIADAVAEGLIARSGAALAGTPAAEPLAEWEKELLEGTPAPTSETSVETPAETPAE
jgi:small subunit ribosomal protein S2